MKEKRDESVEELAQELESRISRKEEADELEEIVFDEIELDDVQEERREPRLNNRVSRKVTKERFGLEKEFPEDDFPEEDNDSMNPWVMAVAMVGIILLAAVICAILWHFTHLEQKGGEEESQLSASVSSEYSASGSVETGGSISGDADLSTPPPEVTVPPESASAPTISPTPTAPAVSPVPAVTPSPAASQATMPSSEVVQEPVSGTTAMEFTQSNVEVTPKDVINLRSEPSTLNADNIVAQAKNGEILNRTGVNEATGWTRLDYNGETLYAVSQYLTTDLTYKPPVQAADPNRVNTMDGRIILFTDCSDNITPKEYVNLRTEPSTSEGESTVRCQISNGEVVHRTGYSPDSGWSRVEYNGEILYVVSSYMYTVQP